MKKTSYFMNAMVLATAASWVQAGNMQLTTRLPDCRMPAGKMLPDKYQTLAKKNKEFAWVRKASADDHVVSGEGWEKVDGSSMHNWFTFYRVDLDNDGICDWYLDASAPLSTGGDRDSINTIYLGRQNGWRRLGAAVPANKPDSLGFGKTSEEQEHYLFGEDVSVIHDASNGVNYLIGAFHNRHVQRSSMPGYLIQVWDANRKTLRLLDKWEPGSQAAAVYGFFKSHGARRPVAKPASPEDTLDRFDSDIEAVEIEQACDRQAPSAALSRHLLARCER